MTTPARNRQARVKAMQGKPGTEEKAAEAVPEPSPELRPRDYRAILDERYPSTAGPRYDWLLGWIEEWVPVGSTPTSGAEWEEAFAAPGRQAKTCQAELHAAAAAAHAEVHHGRPLTQEALAWRHSLEGTRQWPWTPEPIPEPAS